MDYSNLKFPKGPKKEKKIQKKSSIIHSKTNRYCFLCALEGDFTIQPILHEHHIFPGSNRKAADQEGLTVYLCPEHHLFGERAVHNDKDTMTMLQAIGQWFFEKDHTREEFLRLFGKTIL